MKKKVLIRTLLAVCIWITADFILSHLLLSGLNRNYGLDKHSEIFAVGHSHLMLGVDRKQIERELDVEMSKYTRAGVNMNERLLMTRQFLSSPYSDSLRLAIIGVDIYSFQGNGLSENSHLLFYPFFDDVNIGNYLKSVCSLPDYIQHKYIRLSRYSDELVNSSIRGWMDDDRNLKTNQFSTSQSRDALRKWMRNIDFNPELMGSLDSMIYEFDKRGVRVILLNTPTLSIVNMYQPERYDSIIAHYHNLSNRYPGVDFLDLNPSFQDSTHFFSDPVHVNAEGRKKVTDALIDYIKKLDDK